MGLILWIILGGLAGLIASMITRSDRGLLFDVILGILGAVVGGFILSLFGQPGVNGFNLYSLVVSVLGAVILIYLGRLLPRAV